MQRILTSDNLLPVNRQNQPLWSSTSSFLRSLDFSRITPEGWSAISVGGRACIRSNNSCTLKLGWTANQINDTQKPASLQKNKLHEILQKPCPPLLGISKKSVLHPSPSEQRRVAAAPIQGVPVNNDNYFYYCYDQWLLLLLLLLLLSMIVIIIIITIMINDCYNYCNDTRGACCCVSPTSGHPELQRIIIFFCHLILQIFFILSYKGL